MLVLTRRPDEAITIGDQITVTVLRVRGKNVQLGITAPAHMPVSRPGGGSTHDGGEFEASGATTEGATVVPVATVERRRLDLADLTARSERIQAAIAGSGNIDWSAGMVDGPCTCHHDEPDPNCVAARCADELERGGDQ